LIPPSADLYLQRLLLAPLGPRRPPLIKVAMTDLSNDPSDKLGAAIHHLYPDPGDDFGEAYHEACREWLADMTDSEREVLASALLAYGGDGEANVREMLSQLPPAPRLPSGAAQ
jgi:hypothetical protein